MYIYVRGLFFIEKDFLECCCGEKYEEKCKTGLVCNNVGYVAES